jgi:2,3-bisphosphoglycerate-independent phosphoglycerate mutase
MPLYTYWHTGLACKAHGLGQVFVLKFGRYLLLSGLKAALPAGVPTAPMSTLLPNPSMVMLLILDGWGLRGADQPGNAIALAQPAFYASLLETYPWLAIQASGEAVGLPEGQMGNSEVGHLNLGAGRVVYQELTRINKAIKDTDFFSNPALLQAINHAKAHNSTLHLMGLCSDGGVHSSLEHVVALIEMARDEKLPNLRLHAFLDGRDVPPGSAEADIRMLEETLVDLGYPQIATVCGRYYAMDRDNRWDRVQLAYDNLMQAKGTRYMLSMDGLAKAKGQGETDEFVLPQVTDVTFEGIQDNDAVIFFNFRPDRARQLVHALVDDEATFTGFKRDKVARNLCLISMTQYDEALTTVPVAYPKVHLSHLLGEVISQAGLKQFRTAETEKYAHVTYFFNGGIEQVYPGEDRVLIPSPKVATYDEQPHMSLPAVANALVDAVNSREYALLVANFANPDMVGHTGKLPAAIQAVKAIDSALQQVVPAVLAQGGVILLTADHGNIELMLDEVTGAEHTAHSTNPVPLMLISPNAQHKLTPTTQGALANIAPTILTLLGLPIPAEMTSVPLVLEPVAVVA